MTGESPGSYSPEDRRCEAQAPDSGERCEWPATVWRAVRGRGSAQPRDLELCREVHAYGPITVAGKRYADADLTPASSVEGPRPVRPSTNLPDAPARRAVPSREWTAAQVAGMDAAHRVVARWDKAPPTTAHVLDAIDTAIARSADHGPWAAAATSAHLSVLARDRGRIAGAPPRHLQPTQNAGALAADNQPWTPDFATAIQSARHSAADMLKNGTPAHQALTWLAGYAGQIGITPFHGPAREQDGRPDVSKWLGAPELE